MPLHLPQCAERSARVSLELQLLIWQLSGFIGGKCHSSRVATYKRKTQIKIMIPEIGNNFFQELQDSNHWFIKFFTLEVRSLRVFTCALMWFNKADTLVDSSCMDTWHSVWIMAQGLPCKAVLMLKAILFWRTLYKHSTHRSPYSIHPESFKVNDSWQSLSLETFHYWRKTGFASYHLKISGWV